MKTCPRCKRELILSTTMPSPTYLCPNNGRGCYHAEKKMDTSSDVRREIERLEGKKGKLEKEIDTINSELNELYQKESELFVAEEESLL